MEGKMNPIPGKIFCKGTSRYRTVDRKEAKQYKYTGVTEKVGTVRCAQFECNGELFLQPWNDIRLRKPGESNISAKLTTKQVRAIVRSYLVNKTPAKVLAERYSVNESTIRSIVSGRSWRHVTIGYIKQIKAGNVDAVEKCVEASNRKKSPHKLSPSLAKFIVRDHFINKIPIKALATKFCVSVRSIQRIIKGDAWKETTIPALAEFSKWK